MPLTCYTTNKILKNAEERHKAFSFHYFTAVEEDFKAKVERWKEKNEQLKEILNNILEGEANWYKNEICFNEKDLSGTEFKNVKLNENVQALSYTNLEYCSFDTCDFISFASEKSKDELPVFLGCKLNYSIFKNCKFENVNFITGVFKNIVFYNCSFKKVGFDKLGTGTFINMFFQNCNFNTVDFSKLTTDSFCFWGDCEFSNILYSLDTISKKNVIGKDILRQCKIWDTASFENRKENKYIGGPYNKIEIDLGPDVGEKITKFSSLCNCYDGLKEFYKYLYDYEDREGDHIKYLNYYYMFRWLEDEKKIHIKGFSAFRKTILSRYVLGYGVKFVNPLITFFFMIFTYSIIYMFVGVSHLGLPIHRYFSFNIKEFVPTVVDWCKCMYYGTITATSTGYGDIIPNSLLGMFFAATQTILGLILTTMFIVIFGRRFFK